MDISIFGLELSRAAAAETSIDAIRASIQRASREGFSGYWLPQATGLDALTTLAVAGSGISMRLGAAVVPIHTRHPVVMAQQALTANQALNGNLTLGVGASHRVFVERVWGLSFDRSVAYMAEYTEILLLLLQEREAYVRGKRVTMRGDLDIEGPACPVLIAALGPRMLELAGRVAAGTVTWMAGIKTIREFAVPTINEAAAAAGRNAPEVVVGLPVCVTDDIEGARGRAAALLGKEEQASSYKTLLEREGLSGAGDMCVLGSEDRVAHQLAAFFEAGATSILAAPIGTADEKERTWECLAALACARTSDG